MADPTALFQQLVTAVERLAQQQTDLQAQFQAMHVSVATPSPPLPLPDVVSPVAIEAMQTHLFLADVDRTRSG